MASDPGNFPCVNNSGYAVPPFAAVEPDGTATAAGLVNVRKPTRNDSLAVLFNGPLEIPAGGPLECRSPWPSAVGSVAPADLPLAAGAALGVVAGQWLLRATGKGFRAAAPPTLGACQVVPDAAASGAGGSFYARITGNSTKRYSFVQVAVDGSDAVVDVPGGVTGTTSVGYALDIGGGSAVLHTPAPALVVLMTPNPLVAGTWLFGPVTVC